MSESLKEFDKFIGKQQFALMEYGDTSRKAIIGLYKTAWKAALECIQSKLKFGFGVAYSADDILMAIKKDINKELEDE